MANTVTSQLLVDGPRNCVVKFEGIMDTSDLAATGTLGTAATGATTINTPNITFTAGGLAPMVGQYVTGTGIPAGTYLKSFTTTTAILSANATATGSSLTFTLTAGNIVLVDPAALSAIWESQTATRLVIRKIIHNIEDLLTVNLFWDATTPVRIEELAGRGKGDYHCFGGLVNNAGTGVTGKILYSTQGWSAGAVLSFNVILEMQKC